MVRATAAEVLKIMGGEYITGTDAPNIAAILAQGDYLLDGYARRMYNTSISTTDANVINIANSIVYRLALHWIWAQAGGVLTNTPEPTVMDKSITDRIDAVLDPVTEGATYLKMQG